MAREEYELNITSDELREFARRLHLVAANIESSCDMADADKLSPLTVTHIKTGFDGIESIAKFAGAINRAVTEADLRVPLSRKQPVKRKKSPNVKRKRKDD